MSEISGGRGGRPNLTLVKLKMLIKLKIFKTVLMNK